jgi:hypothetical protein
VQELLAGTAITDDSRLRELLYLENPPKGGKSPKRDLSRRSAKKSGPEKGPASKGVVSESRLAEISRPAGAGGLDKLPSEASSPADLI